MPYVLVPRLLPSAWERGYIRITSERVHARSSGHVQTSEQNPQETVIYEVLKLFLYQCLCYCTHLCISYHLTSLALRQISESGQKRLVRLDTILLYCMLVTTHAQHV